MKCLQTCVCNNRDIFVVAVHGAKSNSVKNDRMAIGDVDPARCWNARGHSNGKQGIDAAW